MNHENKLIIYLYKCTVLLMGISAVLLSCVGKLPYPEDDTAPVILQVYPAAGDTNAARNSVVFVKFSDSMSLDGFLNNGIPRIYVTETGTGIKEDLKISLVENATKLVLQRKSGLYQVGTNYSATMETGIHNSDKVAWDSQTNYSWSFTVVNRFESFEPKVVFNQPIAETNQLFLASWIDDFTFSGYAYDPFTGNKINSFEIQYNGTNGSWSGISATSNFFTSIPVDSPIWLKYPQTNNIYLRITYEQDGVPMYFYTNYAFQLDSWTNHIPYALTVNRGYWFAKKPDNSFTYMYYSGVWFRDGGFLTSQSSSFPVITLDKDQNLHRLQREDSSGFLYYNGASVAAVHSSHKYQLHVDSSNRPHIVMPVGNNWQYKHHNGSSWYTYDMTNSNPSYSLFHNSVASVFSTNDNVLHLVYADQPSYYNFRILYKRIQFTGAAFSVLESTNISGTFFQPTTADSFCSAVALDSAMRPHVVYTTIYSGFCKYIYYIGSSWQAATIITNIQSPRAPSIVVDSGILHLALMNNQGVQYGAWNGSNIRLRKVAQPADMNGTVKRTWIYFHTQGTPRINIGFYRSDLNVVRYETTWY